MKIVDLSINNRPIGGGFAPYIIAELSANHNGDIDKAFSIIRMAKEKGADAVKIQTYTPDTITIDCDKDDFQIKGGLWAGKTLYQLYMEAYTPWDWHRPLFDYARELDITIFSSPFDFTAVDLLEDMNAPAYKIASFEAIDIPLIKYAAQTKKPIIISTGMANDDEIAEAIQAAIDVGNEQIAILHCVSGYPAPSQDYNLKTIADMQQRFGVEVGLSDHTISNTTAIAAVSLGATIIEKHVTLDRAGGGPDDSFSLEPQGLEELCRESKVAWEALGQIDYTRKESEKSNLIFRRSLYVVSDVSQGEVFTHENIKSIRPGYGLKPKYLEKIIGKSAKKKIERGEPLDWDMVVK